MKLLLLASASILAFTGAANAEVIFGGNATLGYNDTDADSTDEDDEGFFYDAELNLTLSQELDNGVTAAATFNIELVDGGEGDNGATGSDLGSADFVLSLTSENAGLFYGATSFAAETYWNPAGDMAADNFSEADGETVIRAEVEYFGVQAGVSYVVADAGGDLISEDDDFNGGNGDSIDQLSVGAAATVGMFTFSMGYQEESDYNQGDNANDEPAVFAGDREGDADAYDPNDENGDFDGDEVFGISAGFAFAGADLMVAYASNETEETDGYGIEVSYPIGPVTVGAFYNTENDDGDSDDDNDDAYGVAVDYTSGPIAVSAFYELIRSDDDDDADYAIEGSYDLGNGITVLAGASDAFEDYYVAGTYDLGGGATFLASYGDDGDNDAEDEIGDPEFKEGATVEVSFSF